MLVPFNNVGEIGVIEDMQPHELPPNAWSAARNVRFRDGFAEKFLGHQGVFATPSVAPYFLMPTQAATAYWWIYAGLTKVYAYQGGTHTNITRQTAGVDVDYHATADNVWTGCVLGGVPVLNNPFDPPQKWIPVSGSQRLQPLDYVTGTSTWESLNFSCGAMRLYKNFLVAMDVNKAGVRYPHMVKWSHPADPGAVPVSWDPADPTKDAGEIALSQSTGFVLDSQQLRDVNLIYKDDAIWGMQFIGGVSIFRFYPIFNQLGAMARNCVAEYFSGKHVVFGNGDCVIHDGQNMQSLLSRRQRRALFNRISTLYRERSFVAINQRFKEIWFCYVIDPAAIPNEALVWNWESGALTVRELPGTSFIEQGLIDLSGGADTWDGDSASWDSDSTNWDQLGFSLAEPEMLFASSVNTRLYKGDTTQTFNGSPMSVFLERTGLGIPPRSEREVVDITKRKFWRSIYPRIEGTNGRTMLVRPGYQDFVDGPIVWLNPIPYTIGSSRRLDLRTTGRLLAIRFESTDDTDWRLHGYDLDVDPVGI